MSITLIKNRPVAKIEIDGLGLLSSELTTQLDKTISKVEDLGSAALLVFHIIGHSDPTMVRMWPGPTDIQSVTRWERVLRRIERTDVSTIVFAERECSALALELLLVADCRLVTRTFSMRCSSPGSDVWPSMALYRLTRQIGESQARKLFLNTSDITPERAAALNIIDEIVDDVPMNDPSLHLSAYAPSRDFAIRRRLMLDTLSTCFDDALGAHLAACDRALRRSPTSIESAIGGSTTSAV